MRHRVRSAVAISVVVGLGGASCSRSVENLAGPQGPTTTVAGDGQQPAERAATTTQPPAADADEGTFPAPDATSPVSIAPAATPVSVVEVSEIGVPGLDSADAFCAAWSRFAGSFQVVAVTAAFGSGPPEDLASLEVAAAPTVTAAYQDLLDNWPVELAAERERVADDSLGPFARRLTEAHDALTASRADAAMIGRISDAWLAGLARRDPSTPEFVVDLPDATWAVIDEAALAFAAQRVPFSSDPSLITNVQTPDTDAYLAVSCPDQGTLSGQEVPTP